MASPVGIRVPDQGSCCSKCMYVSKDGKQCMNKNYVKSRYLGKVPEDARFIDGKTGQVVKDPAQFCCNFFDWTPSKK